MLLNELSGRKEDRYKILKCGAGVSGYSFGLLQFDISADIDNARLLLFVVEDFLSTNMEKLSTLKNDISDVWQKLNDHIAAMLHGQVSTLMFTTKDKEIINKVLVRPEAIAVIDKREKKRIDDTITKVKAFLSHQVDNAIGTKQFTPEVATLYSDPAFFLWLMDYDNQFFITTTGKGKLDLLMAQKPFNSFIDVYKYVGGTLYAKANKNNADDVKRRIDNVLQTVSHANLGKSTVSITV